MRRLGARAGYVLLSIMLMIAQVLGATLGAAQATTVDGARSKVVICSAHGPMTVEADGLGGTPAAPTKHDCPCCLAGCSSLRTLAPLVSALAYVIAFQPVARQVDELKSERPPLRATPRGPASPRAPPLFA